jgi:hypothetical protein
MPKHANPRDSAAVFCARHKWPCDRSSTNHFDEIAPPHCLIQGRDYAEWTQLEQGFVTSGMGFDGHFAQQQFQETDVRFGSLADIATD